MESLPNQKISPEREKEIQAKYDDALIFIESSNADTDIKDRLNEILELWRVVRLEGKSNPIMSFDFVESDIRSRSLNKQENIDLFFAVKKVLD